jgi:hypothetical protein
MAEKTIERKKGGRPKKEESDRKKPCLSYWATKAEKEIILKSLEEFGYKKFSYFISDALVQRKIRMKVQYELPDTIQKELRMIGNNYNQIAKILHQNVYGHDLREVQNFMVEVRNSFNNMIDIMKSFEPNYKINE